MNLEKVTAPWTNHDHNNETTDKNADDYSTQTQLQNSVPLEHHTQKPVRP